MNEIWNWIQAQWVEITTTSLLFGASIKTFIVDNIRRVKSTTSYTGLQNTVTSKVDGIEKKFTAQNKVIYEKFEQVENQTKMQLQESLAKDKLISQLVDLNIQTLSVANVPLTAKTEYFENLKKMGITNNATMNLLEKSIEAQKKIQETSNSVKQTALEKLEGI